MIDNRLYYLQTGSTMQDQTDPRLRILVLEDYRLIASQLTEELHLLGQDVLGPFASLDEFYQNDRPFDAALLDVGLQDAVTFDLASGFRRRGVPVVFYTGKDRSPLPSDLRRIPWHQKPAPTSALLDSLWAERRRISQRIDIVSMLPNLRSFALEQIGDARAADDILAEVLETAISEAMQGCIFDAPKWLGERLAVACSTWRDEH